MEDQNGENIHMISAWMPCIVHKSCFTLERKEKRQRQRKRTHVGELVNLTPKKGEQIEVADFGIVYSYSTTAFLLFCGFDISVNYDCNHIAN